MREQEMKKRVLESYRSCIGKEKKGLEGDESVQWKEKMMREAWERFKEREIGRRG